MFKSATFDSAWDSILNLLCMTSFIPTCRIKVQFSHFTFLQPLAWLTQWQTAWCLLPGSAPIWASAEAEESLILASCCGYKDDRRESVQLTETAVSVFALAYFSSCRTKWRGKCKNIKDGIRNVVQCTIKTCLISATSWA